MAQELVQSKWQDTFTQLHGQQGIDGILSLVQAWETALSVLRPRPLNQPPPSVSSARAAAAFELIHTCKLTQSLIDHFVCDLQDSRHFLYEEVLSGVIRYDRTQDVQDVVGLISRLTEWWKHWYPNPQSATLLKSYRITFHSILSSVITSTFRDAFARLLSESIGWSAEVNVPLFQSLDTLGLLDRYESLLSGVVYNQIERRVVETCPKEWEQPQLASLRSWLRETVVPWLAGPYARGSKTADDARVMISGIVSRFDFYVCRTLCDLRIQEIFDIIVDYPDSMEALKDLKECLARVDRRSELVKAIRHANNKRLLHPGADTKLILNQYVSTIKCLRMVDPPGVLLFKVADPIRRYLRDRPDTIRSVIANLVDEGGDFMGDQEQSAPQQTASAEDFSDKAWEPEPMDAGPEFRTNKPSDIITTLVSIYDSKELFVKELQSLLAQRLLLMKDGNYEKERSNIEVLKLRFGENALQVCDVMLKDMADSRRLDQHLQAQESTALHATVISSHFWPPLLSTKLQLPGQLNSISSQYARNYHTFKPDKCLKWIPQLGELELEIQLQDRTITVEASPLQASIIELFSSQDLWRIEDLANQLGSLDAAMVLKAAQLWIECGVIEAVSDNTYRLLELSESDHPTELVTASRNVALESMQVTVDLQDQEAEQVKVFWQFIKGILTNLGPLPAERIQAMLRLAPGYDRSVEQLAMFLESARREGMVLCQDSEWRLNT